ncbi:helix-turn-helix transcriptional regulator [Rhizobium sp. RAF56]|uniref:helix-turn-helix transcriptional regulator n=1 Tax=Rhizobium sp. RAF56 TaxID=3233062 RepID=UPI003F98523A
MPAPYRAATAAPIASPRHDFASLDDDALLTTEEVAALLGVSRWTVKSWRVDKERGTRGPRVVWWDRRTPRYRVADVRRWLETCLKTAD